MPILDVELVGPVSDAIRSGLALRIADAAGRVFGSPTGSTWVKLRVLPAADYAENGGLPEGVLPVFVSVLRRELPQRDEMAREAALLCTAVAQACGRAPESVHVLYEPAAAGRIAFGGRLRE